MRADGTKDSGGDGGCLAAIFLVLIMGVSCYGVVCLGNWIKDTKSRIDVLEQKVHVLEEHTK